MFLGLEFPRNTDTPSLNSSRFAIGTLSFVGTLDFDLGWKWGQQAQIILVNALEKLPPLTDFDTKL